MTKMYKYLYKKMYDDLKDAEMLIDYACHMKEEEKEDVAKYFAENAVYRLSKSFKEAHALFTAHATQEKVLLKNQSLIACGMYNMSK